MLQWRNTLQDFVDACREGDQGLITITKKNLKEMQIPRALSMLCDTQNPTDGQPVSTLVKATQDIFQIAIDYIVPEPKYMKSKNSIYREECLQVLRDVLGIDTVLLSDLYSGVADRLFNQGRTEEAIEFSGRSLLIRIKTTGLVSGRTADSHFQLGNLYLQKNESVEAYKEISAAKIAFSKAYGLDSSFIADCDMILGQLELDLFNYIRAYSLLYSSYRSRYFSLGEENKLTLKSKQLIRRCIRAAGYKIVSAVEIKDRIQELQWNNSFGRSLEYVITVFLSSLKDSEVITPDHLEKTLSKALQFYNENFKRLNDESASDSANISNPAPHDVRLLLNIILTPSAIMYAEPLGTKNIAFDTFSPKSSLRNKIKKEDENTKTEVIQGIVNEVNDPKILSKEAVLEEKVELVKGDENSSVHDITEKLNMVEINPKHQSESLPQPPSWVDELVAARSPQVTPITSPQQNSRPKTWRSIPSDSPLRRVRNIYKGAILPDVTENSFKFFRNDSGELMMLRKCNSEELYKSLRSKIFAFGLLAWLSEHSVQSIKTRSNVQLSGSPAGHDIAIDSNAEKSSDAKEALKDLFAKRLGHGNKTSAEVGSTVADPSVHDDHAALPTGEVPLPPPLPSSWPPIPYLGENQGRNQRATKSSSKETPNDSNISSQLNEVDGDSKPKLKHIFLTGLSSIEGTFWAETKSVINPSELFADLEEEFAVGKAKKKPAFGETSTVDKPATGSASKSKQSLATESILDPQRTQNLNIMLAKFGKRSLDSIAEMINNFDAVGLGASAVNSLMQLIPTSDEVAKVRAFVETKYRKFEESKGESRRSSKLKFKRGSTDAALAALGTAAANKRISNSAAATTATAAATATAETATLSSPVTAAVSAADFKSTPPLTPADITSKFMTDAKVGKAEQYIYIISRVTNLESRLTAMSYVLSVSELHQHVISNSALLSNVTAEIRGSERLKFILKSFLDLNNALIQQSKSGAGNSVASSFPLASWSKLTQVKSNSGFSAHQYVVNKLMQVAPESLELARDIPSIDTAKGVQLGRLSANVKKLEETLAIVEELLKTLSEEEVSRYPRAKENLSSAQQILNELSKDARKAHDQAVEDFQQVCAIFGEPVSTASPESIFGEISSLSKSLQTASSVAAAQLKRKAFSASSS